MKTKRTKEPALYYDYNDKPIRGKDACLKWAELMEPKSPKFKRSKRIVKQQKTWWGAFVSTIWLGLDHSFSTGKPLIYESMVFWNDREIDMDRYSTRAEAKAGHFDIFEKWNVWYAPLKHLWRKFRFSMFLWRLRMKWFSWRNVDVESWVALAIFVLWMAYLLTGRNPWLSAIVSFFIGWLGGRAIAKLVIKRII